MKSKSNSSFCALLFLFVFISDCAYSETRVRRSRVPDTENEQAEEVEERPSPSRFKSGGFGSTNLNWNTKYTYSVGFASAAPSQGVLGQNAAVIGMWIDDTMGFEFLVGYAKSANSATETSNTATDVLANSQAVTTTFTGSASRHTISLGTEFRMKVFHNSWLMVYGGGVLGGNIFLKSKTQTGSVAETIADLDNPQNRSVVETNLGTVETSQTPQLVLGPKLGAEVYLKWFPNLAVGFSTGLVTTMGGVVTTTTSTGSRTYLVVNDVAQDPTASSTTSNVAKLRPGVSGLTVGIGGTTFQFTGIFTIRYVW